MLDDLKIPESVLPTASARAPWSSEQDEYVLATYGSVPTPSIAITLGRSVGAIIGRAYLLGVASRAPRKMQRFSQREIKILRANYHRKSLRALAAMFGRNESSVRKKAILLGLAPFPTLRSPEFKDQVLELNRQGLNTTEIAKQLRSGYLVVRSIVRQYGTDPKRKSNSQSRIHQSEIAVKVPQIVDLLEQGARSRTLQNKLGISSKVFWKLIRKNSPLPLHSVPNGRRPCAKFLARYGMPHKLTYRDFQILLILAAGPLTRMGIAKKIGVSGPNGIGRGLRRLRTFGLITSIRLERQKSIRILLSSYCMDLFTRPEGTSS